ncbi:hypothetical protein PHJA_002856600 [Phtheirospermum japonicum]|uniref:Uncharacterized protein n=1 Tax=Phtheirospermum japonicum TaxID=374723 RepID=A0A830DFB2_9LAMI|nr:hypothetical protein PHJA_002856600 [Phtheirospermum japonicum]
MLKQTRCVCIWGNILCLISKRAYTEKERRASAPFVYERAVREFEEANANEIKKATDFTLVHESLAGECDFSPGDGHKITMLAPECVIKAENECPTMKQVFRSLRKLEVVKQHADYVDQVKNDWNFIYISFYGLLPICADFILCRGCKIVTFIVSYENYPSYK